MRVRLLLGFALAAAGSVAAISVPTAGADPATGDPTHAWFEGGEIDLSKSWGAANACMVFEDHTECFRTEAEMLDAFPEVESRSARTAGEFSILAVCSSYLRLYSNQNHLGSVLSLNTRGSFINLSGHGFDNVTSSYRVGACASTFYAGASGGGAVYGGNTGAFASATAMLPGWDNSISSVYIS
jgi:hypothetical protein